MKRRPAKEDFPVSNVRRFLEPGPIVLVSSAHKGRRNIMTMGWHTVLEFVPSTIGCMISSGNHSHGLIKASRECVINVPSAAMVESVIGIGNCSGADCDKFERFGLTAGAATRVKAPLIDECFASFECRLADATLVDKYSFFVFEVVKAHVAPHKRPPKTLHYRGDGEFMISGREVEHRALFKPWML